MSMPPFEQDQTPPPPADLLAEPDVVTLGTAPADRPATAPADRPPARGWIGLLALALAIIALLIAGFDAIYEQVENANHESKTTVHVAPPAPALGSALLKVQRQIPFIRIRRPAPPAGGGIDPYANSCQTNQTGCRVALLHLINAERVTAGIPALALSWTESRGMAGQCLGAAGHAKAMAASGSIWHTNPAYPEASVFKNFCQPWSNAGQNVGVSPGSKWSAILQIHNMMAAESYTPGCSGNHHCDWMDPNVRTVGFAFVSGMWSGWQSWYTTEDYRG